MASLVKGDKEKSATLRAKLEKIIDEMFRDEDVESIKTECEFCRAVYDIMIKMNDEIGALQVKVPPKKDIVEEYQSRKRGGGKIAKDDLRGILQSLMMKPESFSVGRAATQAVMWIFGAPIGALLAKKAVPGGARVSDDVLLPIATSIAVVILAATHRL